MCLKLPKPPYSGPFKVVNLNLNDQMNYLMESIFVNAPYSESWQDSTRRLLSAIRADGECELRPTTIWLAYRRHKELQEPIKPITSQTETYQKWISTSSLNATQTKP